MFGLAFGELKNIFRTSLIKFYLNSQRMLDLFYHITESRELAFKKRSKTYSPGHKLEFLHRVTS